MAVRRICVLQTRCCVFACFVDRLVCECLCFVCGAGHDYNEYDGSLAGAVRQPLLLWRLMRGARRKMKRASAKAPSEQRVRMTTMK